MKQTFVGSIDQLYILNRTLSQEEVTQIYSAGRAALSPDIAQGRNVWFLLTLFVQISPF